MSSNAELLSSVVIFGVVSILVYFILTRTHRPRTGVVIRNNSANRNNGAVLNGSNGIGQSNNHTSNVLPKSMPNERCLRVPPHVSSNAGKIAVNGGSNILEDGVVAFRYTTAASEDQTLTEDEVIENRKDRARILACLLDNTLNGGITINAPPVKGSTIVLAIELKDIGCSKLRRILYLLGTFYNLFVIIVIECNEQFIGSERAKVESRLRGAQSEITDSCAIASSTRGFLSEQVLPSHRIVAATSVAGRIAFVRQLIRIELMIDFDEEVKKLLSRFVHKVLIFRDNNRDDNDDPACKGSSVLGNVLL